MNIENIHVGDNVVIVGMKSAAYDDDRYEVYGAPAAVVGICAPYLAIRPIGGGQLVRTIDTRLWDVTKCSDDYVNTFTGTPLPSDGQNSVRSRLSSDCPVCREGRFVRVYPIGKQARWECAVCLCVIVEGGASAFK